MMRTETDMCEGIAWGGIIGVAWWSRRASGASTRALTDETPAMALPLVSRV